jgi:hypothetical protein
MSTSHSNAPGYLVTRLTPTVIERVEPIRLIHLDPEGQGAEGFDDQATQFRTSALVVDEVPGFYRYMLASVASGTRRRITGVVVGLRVTKQPCPLWIAVDAPDLEAFVASQGAYLGNVADQTKTLHRLERYEGGALTMLVNNLLSDRPALTVQIRPISPLHATIVPVLITTLDALHACLEQDVELATPRSIAQWLSSTITASRSHIDESAIAHYELDGDVVSLSRRTGLQDGGELEPSGGWPSTMTWPSPMIWHPDVQLLRDLAATGDPELALPAALTLHPATAILFGVATPSDT